MKLSSLRPKDRAFEEFLRYMLHDGDGIARIKPNGFLAGWEISGSDAFSTSWDELSIQFDAVARVFSILDERWTIHISANHYKGGYYPRARTSPSPTVDLLDESRREKFNTHGHQFLTSQLLWISWQPFVQKNRLLDRFIGENVTDSHERETFARTIKQIQSLLSPYFQKFTRIDFEEIAINGKTVVVDRLAQRLGQEIYGTFGVVASDPEMPMFLSHLLTSPVDLQPYLRVGSKYVSVISPRVYPRILYPAMLDTLQFLAIEYRYTVRLTPYSPLDAKKNLGKLSRLHQLGALGIGVMFNRGGTVSQEETPARWRQDVKDAQVHVDEGLAYCSALPQIVVYAQTPEEMDYATEEVRKALQRSGIMSFVEDHRNRFFAFLGTLPGECDANEVRSACMPLRGATRIMPLHSTWHGPEQHPDTRFRNDDAPLLMMSTTQREPFRLYLHVLQVGHALIIGLPGTGKSMLLRTIENAHLARYVGARCLSFDIGRSAYKFTHAIAGQHYMLGLGDGPQIAPLTGLIDDSQFEDIVSWMITFVEIWRPGMRVSIEEVKDLRNALYDLRSFPARKLSDLAHQVQIPSLQEVFAQTRNSLLDAVEDHFSFETATVPYWCFELGKLGIENHRWTVPTMLYLQRRAFAEFARGDAHPTLVTLDESARAFKIPSVEDFAERVEREGRKNRVQFVFATQTPQEIVNSNIRDVLIGTTVTKIALRNAEANTGLIRQNFIEIGFSEEDCYTIAHMGPYEALIKNEYGMQLVTLEPTHLELALLGGASEEDCRQVDMMMDKYGPHWLQQYLLTFGHPDLQQLNLKIPEFHQRNLPALLNGVIA